MATLLEKRQQDCARLGYLLVIEGCPYAFTDVVDIVGTSYISDGREVLPGLELPSALRMGINEREGLPREYSAAFRVTETKDDKLASLFRGVFDDANSHQLTERVTPEDDPLASSLNTTSGTVNPRGKHIGAEYIDSSGNRRSWYIHPVGGATPFDHPWISGETYAPLPQVLVTDEPRIWSGRHVALFELVYDDEAGDWSTWSNQYTNGALIWRGTLQGRGRIIDTLQYEILCDGPASLTRRLLNRTRTTEPRTILPRVNVAASKRGIAIIPHRRNAGDVSDTANNTVFESSVFDDANDIVATSRQALLDELSSLLDDVADGSTTNFAGTGGTSGTPYVDGALSGNGLSIDQSAQLGIRFNSNSDIMGRCSICMHESLWGLLGYEPSTQNQFAFDSIFYVQFKPFDPAPIDLGFNWAQQRDPAAAQLDFGGYWVGEIQTYKPSQNGNGDADNNGQTRWVSPLFEGGTVSIEHNGQQEIGFGLDFFYIEGQKAFPPGGTYGDAEDRPSVNGNQVNAMGWFILEGQIARGENQFAEVEFEDLIQVARCCWYDSGDGTMAKDADGFPTMYIECLEDPRAFGFDHKKIEAPWLSGGSTQVTATPMAVWAYRNYLDPKTAPDGAWRIITRILLSSGTVGAWGTTGQPAFPAVGDNMPASVDVTDNLAGDVEIADMGLGIEDPAVDLISFRRLSEATLATPDDPLGYVKIAKVGPVQSEELIGSLLQGRGWAMGYIRQPGYVQPKFAGVDLYSQFEPSDLPTVAGELIHIRESDIAGTPDDVSSWIPRVEQTWRSPIDVFEVQSRGPVRGGGYDYEAEFVAMDQGASRRTGSATIGIRDAGLSNPELFALDETEWQWGQGFRSRFQETIAGFMGKPNRTITIDVSNPKGQWLYPGQVFLFSHPAVNALDGQSVGVSLAQCVVLEHTKHLRGRLKGNHTIRAMMVGVDLSGGFGKLWGGSAEVLSTVPSFGSAYTLFVSSDWTGSGHGSEDVLSFVEPSWSSIGGDVYVRIYQSRDHLTFDAGDQVTAQVVSTSSAPPNMVVNVTAGTLLADTYKIVTLAPYSDQAAGAWPRELAMFHTDGIGSTHSAGVDGSKLG